MNAIETWYGGILFRSRLEAKWAAFFDTLGWRWEYEPFDLNGYIPDFFLPDFKTKLIVEVKPAITDAAKEKINRSGWKGQAVVVGSGPFPSEHCGWAIGEIGVPCSDGWGGCDGCIDYYINHGAYNPNECHSRYWGQAIIACGYEGGTCPDQFGINEVQGGWLCRRCHGKSDVRAAVADIELIWRSACNETRWQPGKPMPTPSKETCVLCGRVVTNENMAGHGKRRDGADAFYCIQCIHRWTDEAHNDGEDSL